MTVDAALGNSVGAWKGTNRFRLTPADQPYEAPATARVMMAARGNLASIAYTWAHPADGPQDGLLVVGAAEGGEAAVALFADSWHQSPAARSCGGMLDDELAEIDYDYGDGWIWRIVVDASNRDALRIRMQNVVPDGDAGDGLPPGPYDAMVMELERKPDALRAV